MNKSRRTFIKGAAYTSLLATGGISGLAFAGSDKNSEKLIAQSAISDGSALPTCDISIPQNQMIGTETVSLNNDTNRDVTINTISSMGMQHTNQLLAVKVNKLGKHAGKGSVTLAPGEQLSFVVAAVSCDDCGNANNENLFIPNVLAGKLNVSSDHPAFNGIIPVTVFETQV